VHLGKVKAIGLSVLPDVTHSIVQVDMELVPGLVKKRGFEGQTRDMLPDLIERGLSAQLVAESLVTGQQVVELDFRAKDRAKRWGGPPDVIEIPTVPSPFQDLTTQLQTVDIGGVVESLQSALDSAQTVLGNPHLAATLDQLPVLVADMRDTLHTMQREVQSFSTTGQRAVGDSSAKLQETLASVQSLARTLEHEAVGTLAATRTAAQNAGAAMDGANALLDPRGETIQQVQRTIDDLAVTAARLRNVAERVDRDPAVLLRGR
jgi:paraquat-inducible protein B